MSFETILIILISCVLVALIVSLYYNYKLGRIILQVQDDIEECLDVLDGRYKSISQVLNIPIFFDSVEIRRVIQDIERCRESVLYVADRMTSIDQSSSKMEKDAGT